MGKKPLVQIRETVIEDLAYIPIWLKQPNVLNGFPMSDDREIQDSVALWRQYILVNGSITALYKKTPCGCANLYLQTIEKLRHQCLFVILVDEKYRGMGIGTLLIQGMMKRAREKFGIELLHLEVYENNRAIRLYERMGFVEYGRHPKYLKEADGTYYDKILMQQSLV